MAGNNEDNTDGNSDNEINLSNSNMFKKSTKVGYLTSKSTKKGSGNPNSGNSSTKKGVEAVRNSNYPIPGIKKAFNLL